MIVQSSESQREADRQLNAELRPMSAYGGYLFKLKRNTTVLGRWNKRWFNIEGHYLRWYSGVSYKQSSGSIDLRHIRALAETRHARLGSAADVQIVEERIAEDTEFCFSVDTSDRLLVLKAGSKNEMQMWMQQLQMLADRARGGDGNSMVGWQFNRQQIASNGGRDDNSNRIMGARAIVPVTPRGTETSGGAATEESPSQNSSSEGDDPYLLENSTDGELFQASASSAALLRPSSSASSSTGSTGSSRPGSRGGGVTDSAVPALSLNDMKLRRQERRGKQQSSNSSGGGGNSGSKQAIPSAMGDVEALERRLKIEKARNAKLGPSPFIPGGGTTISNATPLPNPLSSGDDGAGACDDDDDDDDGRIVVLSVSPPSSPSAQVSPLAAAAWGGGTTPPMALSSALNGGDPNGNGSNLTPKNQTDPGRRMEVFSRSSTIAGRLERPSSGGSSIVRGQTATDSSVSASIGSIQTGYSLGVKPGSGVSARLASNIVDNPAEYLSPREEEKEGGGSSSSTAAPTPATTVAALARGLAGGGGGKRDHNARGGSQASSYGGFGNGTGDNGAATAMSAGAVEQPTVKVGPKKPPLPSRGSPSSAYRRIGSGSGDAGGGAETGAASPPDIYKSGLRAVQQQQQKQKQKQQQQQQQQQQQPWTEARRAVGVVDTATVAGQREEIMTGTVDTGAVRTFSSVPSTLTTTTFTSP